MSSKISSISINKYLIQRLYSDYINVHRTEALGDIVSADFIDLVSEERGLRVYQNNIQTLLTGFPDVKFEIEELIEEGNKVMARWKWKGTHLGHFAKVAATGRPVENVGIVIFTIKDNKVISTWTLVDRLRVMQQIIPSL